MAQWSLYCIFSFRLSIISSPKARGRSGDIRNFGQKYLRGHYKTKKIKQNPFRRVLDGFLYSECVWTLQSRFTYVILRTAAYIMQNFGFQHSRSLALHCVRQARNYRYINTCPSSYNCLNGRNSESVACNCSCSWCCLWLINELVDQKENLWSLWKFWPISLLYLLKKHFPSTYEYNTAGIKTHHGRPKLKMQFCCNCNRALNALRVYLFIGRESDVDLTSSTDELA